MADGTTPNFGLKLIENGSSRDTWGQKVNDNTSAIDAQLKSNKTTADNALPKAGGTVTGEILRNGQGAHFHWSDDGMDRGSAFLAPSAGTDPTSVAGDMWFGYTP